MSSTKELLVFLVTVFLCTLNIQAQNEDGEFWVKTDKENEFIPGHYNFDFIQDQLSCIQNEVPLNYNTRVHAFVNYFANKNREFTYNMLEKKNVYFPVFEKYLKKYNLPDELKYLSIIESGLNPRAVSSARAVGLWQFMPYTGRSYGLHQDAFIDERMDFEKATEAACQYLRQLHNMFDDWELALAAYNTGPGNVRKAMRRSGKRKFWDIYPYLHSQTRAYLPQFVAVVYVFNHLDELNFLPDDITYLMKYDTVMVDSYMHLPTLAQKLGVCEDDLLSLNTGLRYDAFPDLKEPYPLRLPIDVIDDFRNNREDLISSAAMVDKKKVEALARTTSGSTFGKEKIVYRVRSGDVLGSIAMRHRVKVSDLKRWNNISGDMIRAGQRLDIWLQPGAYKPSSSSSKTPQKEEPAKVLSEDGTKYYIVQPGDSLWEISKKFKDLSIEDIKKLNNLKSDDLKPGQKLKIG